MNGHVRKRAYSDGRVRFVATLEQRVDGVRRRKQKDHATAREARQWLHEQRVRRDQGVALAGDVPTVGELLDEWLEHGRAARGWSPVHARRCAQIVRSDLVPLHRIRADELTARHVDRLLTEKRASGAAPNTVRLVRAAIVSAMNLAMRRGVVARNAASHSEAPRIPRHDPRFLSPQDARRFLAALDGERLGAFYLTSMVLALRPSEALGLRWQDVDLDAGSVRIEQALQQVDGVEHVRRPKTESSRRTLPLPAMLAERLRAHRVRQLEERVQAYEWQDTGLVFTNLRGGAVYEQYARRRLREILAREGLPLVALRELRHTGATLLLSTGVPLEVVKEQLGHTSIVTTTRYARVVEERKREAADRLDAWLAQG